MCIPIRWWESRKIHRDNDNDDGHGVKELVVAVHLYMRFGCLARLCLSPTIEFGGRFESSVYQRIWRRPREISNLWKKNLEKSSFAPERLFDSESAKLYYFAVTYMHTAKKNRKVKEWIYFGIFETTRISTVSRVVFGVYEFKWVFRPHFHLYCTRYLGCKRQRRRNV